MNTGFLGVGPSPDEVRALVPGDALVPAPDVVMDRAFDLPAPPETVWPWIVQLGKERSGWYLPGWAEALIPARRRALRTVDPELQDLSVGDVIADWGAPGPPSRSWPWTRHRSWCTVRNAARWRSAGRSCCGRRRALDRSRVKVRAPGPGPGYISGSGSPGSNAAVSRKLAAACSTS
ncbi:hypothetical protein ACVWYS_003414 [Arthrobacter sp. TE12231]